MNTKPRITRKLAAAIDALLEGSAKTQKDAAKLADMSPAQLCRALKKPHVQQYIDSAIKQHFNGLAKLSASARMSKLIDAASEQVAFNAADRVMRIAGVAGESERGIGGGGIALQIVFKHHGGPGIAAQGVLIEASATECQGAPSITASKSDG